MTNSRAAVAKGGAIGAPSSTMVAPPPPSAGRTPRAVERRSEGVDARDEASRIRPLHLACAVAAEGRVTTRERFTRPRQARPSHRRPDASAKRRGATGGARLGRTLADQTDRRAVEFRGTSRRQRTAPRRLPRGAEPRSFCVHETSERRAHAGVVARAARRRQKPPLHDAGGAERRRPAEAEAAIGGARDPEPASDLPRGAARTAADSPNDAAPYSRLRSPLLLGRRRCCRRAEYSPPPRARRPAARAGGAQVGGSRRGAVGRARRACAPNHLDEEGVDPRAGAAAAKVARLVEVRRPRRRASGGGATTTTARREHLERRGDAHGGVAERVDDLGDAARAARRAPASRAGRGCRRRRATASEARGAPTRASTSGCAARPASPRARPPPPLPRPPRSGTLAPTTSRGRAA